MSEKNFLTKVITETALSRRSFLKWSAALGGTAAMAGGLKFGFKDSRSRGANGSNSGKLGHCGLLA